MVVFKGQHSYEYMSSFNSTHTELVPLTVFKLGIVCPYFANRESD